MRVQNHTPVGIPDFTEACPFCGNRCPHYEWIEANKIDWGTGLPAWVSAVVKCDDCGAQAGFNTLGFKRYPRGRLDEGTKAVIKKAVNTWNTRVSP